QRPGRDVATEAGGGPEGVAGGARHVGPTLREDGLGQQFAAAIHGALPDLDVVRAGPTLGSLVDEPASDGESTVRHAGIGLGYVDGAVVGVVENRIRARRPRRERVGRNRSRTNQCAQQPGKAKPGDHRTTKTLHAERGSSSTSPARLAGAAKTYTSKLA